MPVIDSSIQLMQTLYLSQFDSTRTFNVSDLELSSRYNDNNRSPTQAAVILPLRMTYL